jgi:hypothetical protein
VCDELHDEYSLACEAETVATLRQRYKTLHPQREGVDQHEDQQQWEVILSSRKRQMKIASTIQKHRTLAHSA